MYKNIILISLLSSSSFCLATEAEVAALAVSTAAELCQTPVQKGENHRLKLRGQAQASLGKTLRQLAQLNGNADAEYQAEEWVGVNQNQLAQAMQNGNSCKLEVFKLIMSGSNTKGWSDDRAPQAQRGKTSGPFLQHTNGGASPLLTDPRNFHSKVEGCNNVEANARVELLDEYQGGGVTFVKVKVLEGTCSGLVGWTNKNFYKL
ncbi:hypothetical protein [uncultured Rheinheimera sp.]|uniref:hypothetical protein n=1 Tax=uncultured Rheinheimera sp. TaxID=400532 RepID=UPI0025995CDC|nr:hypothetical protein [uncultured Rheinheimera sp.]